MTGPAGMGGGGGATVGKNGIADAVVGGGGAGALIGFAARLPQPMQKFAFSGTLAPQLVQNMIFVYSPVYSVA